MAFKKAKASYSYYSRMKMVAILLKWNLVDFITQKEQIQAIDDAVFYYEWRIKTKKYHIQISEKKLEENKNSDETLKRTLQNDKKEYDIYAKKLEIVNKLKDEINSFTGKKVEFSIFFFDNQKFLLAFNLTYLYINMA